MRVDDLFLAPDSGDVGAHPRISNYSVFYFPHYFQKSAKHCSRKAEIQILHCVEPSSSIAPLVSHVIAVGGVHLS